MPSESIDKQVPERQPGQGAMCSSSSSNAETLLLEFVQGRNVECPRCGYNLRDLTKPVCPECREELTLSVGLVKARFGWFVMALIPGVFSGICACFLAIPINLMPLLGQQSVPIEIVLLDGFGWLSGFFAVGLFLARHRFLQIGRTGQIVWALVLWAIHLLVFVIFLDFVI